MFGYKVSAVFLKPSIQMLGHYFEIGHNRTHPLKFTKIQVLLKSINFT